jgi:hypothetical protein
VIGHSRRVGRPAPTFEVDVTPEDLEDEYGVVTRYYRGLASLGGDVAVEYSIFGREARGVEVVVRETTSPNRFKFVGATTCPSVLRPRRHEDLDSSSNKVVAPGLQWEHRGDYQQGRGGAHVAVAAVAVTEDSDAAPPTIALKVTILARDPWTADYQFSTELKLQ